MIWLYACLAVLSAIIIPLNVIACIALYRTDDVGRIQKVAQAAIIWLVPLVGAMLVLRIINEQDEEAVPRRWIPNDTINAYVRSALGVQARGLNRVARDAIESEIVETFSSGGAEGGD